MAGLNILIEDSSTVSLTLECRRVDDEVMVHLATVLEGNTTLKHISLACSSVTISGVESLMQAGCFAHLSKLELHGLSLGDVGASQVVAALRDSDWPALQTLRYVFAVLGH